MCKGAQLWEMKISRLLKLTWARFKGNAAFFWLYKGNNGQSAHKFWKLLKTQLQVIGIWIKKTPMRVSSAQSSKEMALLHI